MGSATEVAAQAGIRVFDEPAAIQSFIVDSTVLDIPGALKQDKGDGNFGLAVSTFPLGGSFESGSIGKTATGARSFGYFAAAAGFASADVWSEFRVLTPAIPEEVMIGDDVFPVGAVEIQIKGRIRAADLDLAACGAAWTAELRGVHFGAPGAPDAGYEFPSVGCIVPETEVFQIIDDIQTVFDVIGVIDQVFQVAGVALGFWEDFVVRIPLYDIDVPRNQPLNLTVQLGRRVGSALAAASISGGEIDVAEIRVVGWAGLGPTTYLRTWHYYGTGALIIQRLMEEVAFDVEKARKGIEPYPEVTFTCPPYPIHRPVTRLRGRIYVNDFSWLWRLDSLQLDRQAVVPVPGDTCSLGPITMDFSHRVAFTFQEGVADYVITGFRTVPAPPQRGQPFDLHIALQNTGDLSTLEANRTAPLSGEFKFRIQVGSAQTLVPEVLVLQPGATAEFYGQRWTCDASVEVTVDIDNEIEEGLFGEVNNTARLTLPSCEAPTPTATPIASGTHTPTATPTFTPMSTATPTRTPSDTRTATGTPSSTRTPTVTPSPSPTPPPTITPTAATPTPLCTGDCDGNGRVTVNELLTLVNIALGNLPLSRCLNGDADGNAAITIAEIVRALTYALAGCPGTGSEA